MKDTNHLPDIEPTKNKNKAEAVWRAVDLVCDRWVNLIMHSVFVGQRRFADLLRYTGMARSLLASRLKRMEEFGLIYRKPYQDKPIRYDYRLTNMGRDLFDVSMMIVRWEKIWHDDARNPVLRSTHRSCGEVFTAECRCSECGEVVTGRDVEFSYGKTKHKASMVRIGRDFRRSKIKSSSLETMTPMLERSMEIWGDAWSVNVISAALCGKDRFSEFEEVLDIAPNILTDRLNRLVEFGILEKRQYQVRPDRKSYHVTQKGYDLYPVLLMLIKWEGNWLADAPKFSPKMTHTACGKQFTPIATCDNCHEPIVAREVRLGGVSKGKAKKTVKDAS